MADDIDYQSIIKYSLSSDNTLCKKKIAEWLREKGMKKNKYIEVCNVLRDLNYKFIVPQVWTQETANDMKSLHGIDASVIMDLAISEFDESVNL